MAEQTCASCGYTEADAKLHGDHRLCKNAGNAPWEKRKLAVPRPEAERAQKPEETMSQEDETMRKDTDRMLLNLCDNERPPASEWGFSGYLAKLPAEPSARPEAEKPQTCSICDCTREDLDELVRAEIDEGLYYRQPVEPSAQPAGMCKGDLVERICRAICKVEAIDPDSGEDTDGPNWVRYADAVHQEVLQTAQPAGSEPQYLEPNHHWKWFRDRGQVECPQKDQQWHKDAPEMCRPCDYAKKTAEAYIEASRAAPANLDSVVAQPEFYFHVADKVAQQIGWPFTKLDELAAIIRKAVEEVTGK